MTRRQLDLVIHAGLKADDVQSRILDEFNEFVEEAARTERRRFHDTFDWRLYRHGYTLEDACMGDQRRLVLRSLDSGRLVRALHVTVMPQLAVELPPGPFRELIADIVWVRALMPRVEVVSRSIPLRMIDGDQKTVLGARIETHRVKDASGRLVQLAPRVSLDPVKGYGKPVRRVRKVLEGKLGLEAAGASLLDEALAAQDRRAADYSSRPDVSLDPEMRADVGLRRVLLQLLDVMEANLEGTRAHLDSEFLHDFRVSVRRTRSALAQIPKVFPRRVVDPFSREFRWVGDVSSPTRDMDVYVLKFDRYCAMLPAKRRDHLKPFLDFLLLHQQQEQAELTRQLESARWRRLAAAWRGYLSADPPARTTLANARRPVRDVADERIWRAYRRVIRAGRKISRKTPASALHKLRLHCKKLRYLMEFFRSLYPQRRVSAMIAALKDLQYNLGDFHDFEVQAATLPRMAKQMQAEGEVSEDTLKAIAKLAKVLRRSQQRERAAFDKRFRRFDEPANRTRFKKLFKPKVAPEA